MQAYPKGRTAGDNEDRLPLGGTTPSTTPVMRTAGDNEGHLPLGGATPSTTSVITVVPYLTISRHVVCQQFCAGKVSFAVPGRERA